MMRLKPLLSLVASLLCGSLLFAQSPVSVNPVSGTASVTIPVHTVTSGGVSAPIFLQYSATGVKTRDVESTAGVGWNLMAGGQISRMVRGLPDDCTQDSSGSARVGWMSASNTTPGFISGWTPQNTGSGSCTSESNDISFVNGNFPYTQDTEPDLFYVNAPGLSCQLIFSNPNQQFYAVGYQDLVISYNKVTMAGNHFGNITQFTITNDKGITYVFAKPEMVTEQTTQGLGGNAVYFNRKYQQYQNKIKYADAWNLISMTDQYNNSVLFNYSVAPVRNGTNPIILYIGGSSGASIQYYDMLGTAAQTLTSISTSNNNMTTPVTQLTFSWNTLNGTHQSGQTIIYSINGLGHSYQFNYNTVVSTTSQTGFPRDFLASFTDAGCGSPVNYQFGYVGQTYSSGTYYTALPDSAAISYDYWGYYSTSAGSGIGVIPEVWVYNPATTTWPRYAVNANGSPSGGYTYLTVGLNSLQVTPSTVATGTLNQITYPQGGSTSLVYESNDYLDAPSNTTMYGGGIRVKQITESPGTGSTNAIVRNYTYTNPSTGLSSGAPVSMPQYAFTVPYNGSATGTALYTAVTAISTLDMSTEDHSILYGYVTVTQTLAGKTVNQYSNPYTYWSSGFGTTELISRYNCPGTYGPIGNFANWYPFIPNPNYDYQRGLLVKSTNYNDGGNEVSESDYTYNISNPNVMMAFKGENSNTSPIEALCYNVYPVFYGALVQPATVTTITYDSQSQSSSQSSSVSYTYGSAYHHLLTQQQTTNSDGTVITANYSYVKDFPGAGSEPNDNITALYNLRQANINAPVESYTQVTPPGGTLTYASAALTYFRDTSIASVNYVLPSNQFKWVQPNGASFNKLIVTGNTITRDTHYFGTLNYDRFDNTGFPVSTDDNYRHIQTSVLDHYSGKAVASFSNALYQQVAFNDFDSDPGTGLLCNFTFIGAEAFTPTTSHAGNAYGMGSGQTATSPTLLKNGLAVNYIFSIWTSATVSGSTITVTANGNNYPITLNTSGAWTYNEIAIPASVFTGSVVVTFTCNQNVAIDDILLYPDCAQAATVTYDAIAHHKLAATNTNGVSNYFNYDQWNRLLYQYDQDKNITLAKAYITPANVADYVPAFYPPATGNLTAPVVFNAYGGDPCTAAANVYTWKFGDGTSTVTTTPTASHTYTSTGTFADQLTVQSNYFPTQTFTNSIYITAVANVPLHYVNNCTSGATMLNVVFSQGGVQKYNISADLISSSTVVPGVYTINVYMDPHDTQYNPGTGVGYQSVELLGTSSNWCYNFSTTNAYTYTGVDLTASTYLTFEVNTSSCP